MMLKGTYPDDFSLAELARGRRHLSTESADFALLANFTQQLEPDSLDLSILGS
jgi:hypothetical protein